eukprot:856691-Pelagomonas_calceolata.AAC.3
MGWGCFKFSLPPEFLEALQQDFVRKNGFQGLRTVLWHLFGANTILAWVKAEGDVETRLAVFSLALRAQNSETLTR